MSKYLHQCRFCGALLFKTTTVITGLLAIEIKCPNCKKILKTADDIIITLIRKKDKGGKNT